MANERPSYPIETLNDIIDAAEYYDTRRRFDALLDLAADACLTAPLETPPIKELTTDQKVIAQYGILGLRAAYETWMGYDGSTDNTHLAPLLSPGDFVDTADMSIIQRVEQFGKQLIDEAFMVLGEGADKQVELFKYGTRDQKVEAACWLDERLSKMVFDDSRISQEPGSQTIRIDLAGKYDDEINNDRGRTFYHPARLSPKLTGVYPNNELRPTCLMTSILAASFFEKAGAKYLHAGVMQGADFGTAQSLMNLLNDELDRGSSPALVRDKYRQAITTITDEVYADTGFHAAIYAKIEDDQWIQVDPNMDGTAGLWRERADDVNNASLLLYERADIPHLQLSVPLTVCYDVPQSAREVVRYSLGNPLVIDTLQSDMLLGDQVKERVYSEVIYPYIMQIIKQMAVDHPGLDAAIYKLFFTPNQGSSHEGSIVKEAYNDVFDRYVLWGESLEAVQRRMQADPEYLQRRLEDIAHLSTAIMVKISQYALTDNNLTNRVHLAAELGLPHARIGFSVLSDFAAYCDDSLPPSFWATYWPSVIPVSQQTDRKGNTPRQQERLRRYFEHHQTSELTFINIIDKLDSFLSDAS